jgi:hypothetical protein
MKCVHGLLLALTFSAQVLVPAAVSAQIADHGRASAERSRFEQPTPVFAGAAQSTPTQALPSRGRPLLRNALIGAGIGAALTGVIAMNLGDCGNCGSDTGKAMASGAFYGALIGAAISFAPSRRPSSSRSSWEATVSSKLTKHVKALNVAVRF